MKIETYKHGSIPEQVFVSVSELLHDAFEERRQQGLNFKCGLFSPEDVKAYLNGGGGGFFWFVLMLIMFLLVN